MSAITRGCHPIRGCRRRCVDGGDGDPPAAVPGRNRRRYGPLFSVNMAGLGRLVVVSDPDLIKQVFMADPKTLHAGQPRRRCGRCSATQLPLLGIDEEQHMEQRKLLLPPFQGRRMRSTSRGSRRSRAEQIAFAAGGRRVRDRRGDAENHAEGGTARLVFGASGERMARLEALLPPWTSWARSLPRFPRLQRLEPARASGAVSCRLRAQVDAILDELIDEARTDPDVATREDVLAPADGAGPPRRRRRAEQRGDPRPARADARRRPRGSARTRSRRAIDGCGATFRRWRGWSRGPTAAAERCAKATIREVQRMRPADRLRRPPRAQTIRIAGYTLPKGVLIGLSAGLTHYDPRLPAPRPLRPRPLPRGAARDLLVDPLRRRHPPLPSARPSRTWARRRAARAADERRAAAAPTRRTSRGSSAASRGRRPAAGWRGSAAAPGAGRRRQPAA